MESISIHALLAESDRGYFKVHSPPKKISIHALLAESDWREYGLGVDCLNFYPRSPCGERQQLYQDIAKDNQISIHALLAESDT